MKRCDTLRKKVQRVSKELECGELPSGRGLNQKIKIKRARNTHWIVIMWAL